MAPLPMQPGRSAGRSREFRTARPLAGDVALARTYDRLTQSLAAGTLTADRCVELFPDLCADALPEAVSPVPKPAPSPSLVSARIEKARADVKAARAAVRKRERRQAARRAGIPQQQHVNQSLLHI